MSKLIVVVGATGNQGGSVVRTFLREAGWSVRGITRDPSKPSSKSLIDAGVELVAADLDDKQSLVIAFSGASAIFAVTDFWQFARDPTTFARAKELALQPNRVCYDRELAQAKNLIDAAADPTILPNLERFVFSTLSATNKRTHGAIKCNLHFDGKAAASEYLSSTYPALDAKTCSLQVGHYMTNWQVGPTYRPQKQENGDYALYRPADVEEKHKYPYVHPPQDTGPFVRALVLEASAGTTMLGVSQLASPAEYCDTWTKVLRARGLIGQGSKAYADYSKMTLADVEVSRPGGFGKEAADSMKYAGEHGWTGGDLTVRMPEECGVYMSDLSSLESYMTGEDWSSVV